MNFVVTRFAPSPTGYLHIGSIRTALINYIFTKQNKLKHSKSKFLLRIEDTDKTRSNNKFNKSILNGLQWLEIEWDEDIVIQSKRIDRHKEIAYELLKKSINDPNPVIFIEHRWLHNVEEKYKKKMNKIAIGKSECLSKGKDFTAITYSLSTIELLSLKKFLNNNNIYFDLIDLKTIKPLDLKPAIKSLKKTGKLLILDSISHPICSVGSEILSQISRDKRIKFAKPPVLLTLPDIPSPTSTYYTKEYYISKKDIIEKIKILTGKKLKLIFVENTPHDIPDVSFKGPF